MELKKCARCGSFYVNDNQVCPKCMGKDTLELQALRGFFEDNDNRPIDLPPLPVIEGERDMAQAFMPTLSPEGINLKDMVASIEISMIKQALSQSNGVVAKASEVLGLRRTTLVEKMKKYGIAAAN